ncbi:MAG: hypothetical protein LBQ41_02905 [Candidatus Ancillula sp.]|jgi:hypothetical protein|nr:hypothetical protein [Candidatus Ancillula sp.]
MYRALLDLLPIHWFFKLLLVIIILAGVSFFCFTTLFPYIVDFIPYPFGNLGFEEAVAQ